MKKLSESEFLNVYSNSFYKKVLKESLISFKYKINKKDAKIRIYNAYEKLMDYDYSISSPTEYIYLLKNEYVARILPVFQVEDEGIYFYLCKQIENDIAINRIPGTFGGWVLGNSIKQQEDDEIQYVFNSYNPWLWTKYWKEYQQYIYTNIDKNNYKYALKLDIANFYDSINVDILAKQLYKICAKDKYDYVNLIVYILKYWNRKFGRYLENTVGIPQNEFGDQSRLLANTYLNEYDEAMYAVCNNNDALYSRYADDQIILFNDDRSINKIMYIANRELRKLGLNINAGKTKKFTKYELIDFYLFIPLEELEKNNYNKAIDLFFEIIKKNGNIASVRSDTFFRRCLSIGLKNFSLENRSKILIYILRKEFIITSNVDFLHKIYINLFSEEKEIYIKQILEYFDVVVLNGFHYNVINFFKKEKLMTEYEYCKKKIEEVLVC